MALFAYVVLKIIAILKSEKKLKEIIDKHIIFSTTDIKGNITSVSNTFCNISGHTKEELIGKNHNVIRHPDMEKDFFKKLWDTIKRGGKFNGNIKNRTKKGTSYWVNAKIEPVFNSKGQIESYISIGHDITDKKTLEALNDSLNEKIASEVEKSRYKDQQMIEQSRLAQMGEMISMIAHQWRQPLSAIGSISASLELKAKLNRLDNEMIIKQASNISKYAQHLSETINDFRDFFKPVKAKQNVTFSEVVHSSLGIVGKSIENENISIVKKLDSEEHFETYASELKQVVLNLLKNAEDILLEKQVKNPTITISTFNNTLSISDNAGGVPEEIVAKIFDPYFSTKLEKNGTGLGLYMSKIIIEEHCGGTLSVSNSDEGAIFKIELSEKNSD